MHCTLRTMDTPGSRLKAVREQRGFETARDAARYYSWPVDAYASHENGNRGIPPDAAVRYARAFHFSLDWLYRGHTQNVAGIEATPHIAFQAVPRLLWNFLKIFGSLEQAMEQATEFASLPKTLNISMPAFSMTIADDSMKNSNMPGPSFEEGEEIIFSTKESIKPGDFVLAEIYDENAVVFRQYRERGKDENGFTIFELASLNPAFRNYLIQTPGQARLVAKMTHSIKSYK